MPSFGLGEIIAVISALGEASASRKLKLKGRQIEEMRKALRDIHFGHNGSLNALKYVGLDAFISVLQRDTIKSVSRALDTLQRHSRDFDLPIDKEESLEFIRQTKRGIRVRLSQALLAKDEDAVSHLVSDIEKLNKQIEELDRFLFDLEN